MKESLAILVNKAIYGACRLFKKNGSVYPGSISTKISPDILDNLKYPKYIVGVTGSSGKGSTTSMVAHILEGNGYKVVWNKSGSNLYNAAATLLLNNTGIFSKKINADVLLLELDESFISRIFRKVKLTHLVVTNITRDQPARNGHPDIIFDKIRNSIGDETHLIINADDPTVSKIKLTHKGNITTYGVGKYKDDLKKPITNNIDSAYCPSCGAKLKYSYYHYGHIGNYECPNCSFSRGKVDYEAKNIDMNKQFMTINDSIVHLNKNVFFAVYYTLAAFAVCKELNLSTEQIQKELNDNILESKRMKQLHLDNRTINMIESKNENALSYLQSINYIKNESGIKTVILGFDNVSRRYSYNDLSWLYDVDFEKLNDKSIDKIYCIGRFRYDVYARLIHAGIPETELILIDDLNKLIPEVRKHSKGNIYTMVCFDMTANIKKLLSEVKHENN